MEDVRSEVEKITLKEFEVLNTSSPAYPGTVPGKQWSVDDFKKRLRISIVKKEDSELEFDLVGVDPSLANAFRRILISEVPTMAIEKVHIYNNTSIIQVIICCTGILIRSSFFFQILLFLQDEVFAHRLGLIPLKADPRKFEWKSAETDDAGTEKDTLEFQLKVKCKKSPTAAEIAEEKCVDRCVYTKHIKWIPRGDQASWMDGDPGACEGDILLNKMLPGHELDMKMFAYKGIGQDHAKFSPVATAFYRLLPEITLNRTVKGEEAVKLQKCFSPGVIELEGSKQKAVVRDARYDACSRNIFRHEDLKDAVTLSKVRDHFIFTVESTGAMQPEELFVQAVDILGGKCDYFLRELDTCRGPRS